MTKLNRAADSLAEAALLNCICMYGEYWRKVTQANPIMKCNKDEYTFKQEID